MRACVYMRDTCYGARLCTLPTYGVRQLERVEKGEAPNGALRVYERIATLFPPFLRVPGPSRNNRRYITHPVTLCGPRSQHNAATLSTGLVHYVPKRYPTEKTEKKKKQTTE